MVRGNSERDDRKYLGAFYADYPVKIASRVVEEADVDGLTTRRDPGALSLGIDMEDVRFAAEDGLFPEQMQYARRERIYENDQHSRLIRASSSLAR